MDAITRVTEGLGVVLAMTSKDAQTFRSKGIDAVAYEDNAATLDTALNGVNALTIAYNKGENAAEPLEMVQKIRQQLGAVEIWISNLCGVPVELLDGPTLQDYIKSNAEAWAPYFIKDLGARANEQQLTADNWDVFGFVSEFMAFYDTLTAYEIRTAGEALKGYKIFEGQGITPEAMKDHAKMASIAAANQSARDIISKLNKAAKEGASLDRLKVLAHGITDISTGAWRDSWKAQFNQTFAQDLRDIAAQPETLKTKWKLGNIGKDGKFRPIEKIEFWPADITVFCAPTSHGKTMILCQAAIDAVRTSNKHYIYLSCEESRRQLTERLLNVYISTPVTETGRDDFGGYCFIQGTRKKAIKAIIKGADEMEGYTPEHFDALKRRINSDLDTYEIAVFPRLHAIHVNTSAEEISRLLLEQVEELRQQYGPDAVGAVFLDYMQLLSSDSKAYSRHDELKDICQVLKDCAAKLEIPVVVAAQLNRNIYDRNVGLDGVTVANMGEGSDIEKIAHDIYLVWQIDKTPAYHYQKTSDKAPLLGPRIKRILRENQDGEIQLRESYLYVEHLKARDGVTGIWALLPYIGESGQIDQTDTEEIERNGAIK